MKEPHFKARQRRNQWSAGLRPAALRQATGALGDKRAFAVSGPLRLTEPRSEPDWLATSWKDANQIGAGSCLMVLSPKPPFR
jgi:hypothetical protein